MSRRPTFTTSLLLAVCMTLLGASCSRSTEPTSTAAAPPTPQDARVFDFSADQAGDIPAGFSAGLTGGGEPGDWKVQDSGDNAADQVVTQLNADSTNARYPHLAVNDFGARDVDVAVKFKTLSGKVDASGGILFRYRDPDNYYVVRANALEDNVVAYKTQNGKRSNIGVKGQDDAYGVEAAVPHQTWNTLRVVAKGSLIEIFLNDRKLFEVEDHTFDTAGSVGLWTKADAVTQFDDLTIKAL